MRVLLIAEACNPSWPSVPLVGYNFARALSRRDDLQVTLVTHVKNRPALADDPLATRARLEFVDNEWLARPMYRLATRLRGGEKLAWTLNTALAWPSYLEFERQVYRRFASELKSGRFDLIHRLTPLSPTLPSPLATWTDVPMLLGPINGGLPWPREFPGLAGEEREWLARFRPAYRALPYFRQSYRRLAGVVAGSRHTASEVPRYFRGRRFYLPENGIDPERFEIADGWHELVGRFRFITVGRLVPYKGLPLILEAFSGSKVLRGCELVVVGDGPLRPEAERFVRDHQLGSSVRFEGWMNNQHDVAAAMRGCQAFVFPSLREFGGGVVLEAMASGLPCVVVDYGGPSELLTTECGIRIPMQPRDTLIVELQSQLERLVQDLHRCRAMGAAAVARVRDEFTWDVKAGKLRQFYGETVAAGTTVAQPK